MEDHTPQRPAPTESSARSAAALRQLEQRARAALAASRDKVSKLEEAITAQLETLAAELAQERQERASHDQWKEQLADLERKLAEQRSAWDEQRSQWSQERAALEQQHEELRQKFQLALEDVQRLRGRVAELEQELASRPETNEADSAELVALRTERDALAAQVEELQHSAIQQVDADTEQQLADLQRRFELAVEDLRELKTTNAQLEAKLAAANKPSGDGADAGGMDWESQKRRLLASLADGEEQDEADPQARATIQGTIDMTDAIVAGKDREIADLKAQLAAGSHGSSAEPDAAPSRLDELLDADEVIAEHRKRIATLEEQTQEKLRAAELELSLERAKIARQRVELDDLRAELDSQRSALAAQGAAPDLGVPRRRWLSKLGLSGDES